ncbi:M48 family metallopeptidase [Chryseolinea lacunae]|uniref:M48 family metalloprotease n=1 Tax=Chryseolinea lacunae TaxID=2801331 RepID=A0ABS1KTK6_9BACT|nr:M48 family metalloprotease [Chryseolinea lacunae]MBL0742643.1 M48 family metalloprotease [Chryseolinea lacunae]
MLGIRILIDYLVVFFKFVHGKRIQPGNASFRFSFRDTFFEWILFSLFFAALLYVLVLLDRTHTGQLSVVMIFVLVAAASPIYGFVIQPMLSLFIYKETYRYIEETKALEQWVLTTFKIKVNIRLLDKEVVNAYATGVIPFSKLIILGRPLFDGLSQDDIKGLILHELGHTVRHHLLVLYGINVVTYSIGVVASYYLFPLYETTPYAGLFVFLHGAVFYGLLMALIPGLVQRRIEYAADKFAAIHAGAAYATALTNLNILSEGGLMKGGLNYPSLKKRLARIHEVY